MKKNIIFMAALAMMATACSNEDDSIVTNPETDVTGNVKMITETITATNSDSKGSTRADISDNATFAWSAGDKIAVHVTDGKYHTATLASEAGTNQADFTVTYPDGSQRDAFAVYPASFVTESEEYYGQDGGTLDVTLPSSYTQAEVSGTKTPCPMIASNTGDSWEFSQLCGLLRLTVNNIPHSTTYLEIDFNGMKVQGTFSLTNPAPGTSTIATSTTTGTDDIITITDLSLNEGWTDGMVLNLPLPTGSYTDVTVTSYNNSGEVLLTVTNEISYSATRAHGRKVTASMPTFTVSADKKKVVFAPGNLQYLGNADGTGTWRFAEHQYDFMGDGPSSGTDYQGNVTVEGYSVYNTSDAKNAARDLFGWGTSGYNNKYPYMTSTNSNSYYSGSLTDTDYDWGVYHSAAGNSNEKITNAGNYSWRLFTSDEWAYIIAREGRVYTRQDVPTYQEPKKLFACATVVGVKGIILFPGHWDGSLDRTIKYGNPSGLNYNGATCDAEKWAKFEKQGCVFLPAANVRKDNSFTLTDYLDEGHYWSSTLSSSNRGGTLEFTNTGTVITSSTNACARYLGQSVRLIRDIE